ncbi:MAG: VapB-type antitoxin [Thermoprotei archaeon]|nr:MAG: VapB-type antitoxin [Thermoprotei archaeon]HDD34201.1 VapB-type antitoxin [Thermofilaceae archaeon]
MSAVVSFRISRELKERMDKLKHINWSEVVRRAIYEVVVREEVRLRRKDVEKLRRAVLKSEELSRRVVGWRSVEEIRRWRERRW